MTQKYKERRAAKHAAERVITSAEFAAAHAAAPSDYKRGGDIIWQLGTTDELTCQLLVCFVLWNQPRAQWFKASRRAITLTFPSMKANGTVQCTLDPQAYSTLLNDTIGQQHFNNIMLEHKVKSWMQTHQSGEPALLCTFAVLNEVVSFSTHEAGSARYGRTQRRADLGERNAEAESAEQRETL